MKSIFALLELAAQSASQPTESSSTNYLLNTVNQKFGPIYDDADSIQEELGAGSTLQPTQSFATNHLLASLNEQFNTIYKDTDAALAKFNAKEKAKEEAIINKKAAALLDEMVEEALEKAEQRHTEQREEALAKAEQRHTKQLEEALATAGLQCDEKVQETFVSTNHSCDEKVQYAVTIANQASYETLEQLVKEKISELTELNTKFYNSETDNLRVNQILCVSTKIYAPINLV